MFSVMTVEENLLFTHLIHDQILVFTQCKRERETNIENGETVKNVYSENMENYVMVPSSVVKRLCNPGYLGESIGGSESSSSVVGNCASNNEKS